MGREKELFFSVSCTPLLFNFIDNSILRASSASSASSLGFMRVPGFYEAPQKRRRCAPSAAEARRALRVSPRKTPFVPCKSAFSYFKAFLQFALRPDVQRHTRLRRPRHWYCGNSALRARTGKRRPGLSDYKQACRKRTRSEWKARDKLPAPFRDRRRREGRFAPPPALPRAVIRLCGIRAAGRFPWTTGVAVAGILAR